MNIFWQIYKLAKNVPFTLEEVTVLLQMHIMEKAPYKSL